MMNIIFLDVDGVLNSINNLIKIYNETHKQYSGYSYPFDNECLKYLKELVEETNSYLVITSTWRKTKEGINKLYEVLKEYNLDNRIIGFTPILGLERGLEIQEYMNSINPDIKYNFIILDDDSDMGYGKLSNYLIKTNIYTGLTKDNIKEAILKLNKM